MPSLMTTGCAIALLAGYSYEQKLAGVAGLSGWLPLHNKFASVYIFHSFFLLI